MAQAQKITLVSISQSVSQLAFVYDIDGVQFTNSLWYDGVDFGELEKRFGTDAIRKIVFHIAAFEINKVCSLMPARIDWGDYSDLATPDFAEVWQTIFRNVWAQWRFENDKPEYFAPTMETATAPVSGPVTSRDATGFLSFCGGGKDSLVALELLSRMGVEHATLAYSASYYGRAEPQHRLIGRMLDAYGVERQYRQWIYDDFLDSPVLELRPDFGVETLTAAETPSSLFGSLPYVLMHQLRYVCLAHERSADAPQVVWEKTGEPVNHQWGKSFEAEDLINRYIQRHLVEDYHYFSVLKPIYDVSIFGALRNVQDTVPFTHSCNIDKPWCRRCAKCLYVWMGYAAFVEKDVVTAAFGSENLFDVEENVMLFRELVGLESKLPFECIGEADEAALFMLMARAKGYTGIAFDACAERLDALDANAILAKYSQVVTKDSNVPDEIAERLGTLLDDNAEATRNYVTKVLEL